MKQSLKANDKNELKAAKENWQELKSNKKAMRQKRNSGRGKAWLLAV